MNCCLCSDRPKFFCPCSKCFICSNHITQHLSLQGAHCIEAIDKSLPNSKKNVLQKKLIERISAIDEAKLSISVKIKNLIQKITSQCMSSIKELESQAQWYLNLSRLSMFSVTLIKEVDRIVDTELNIELPKQEFSSKFQEIFNQEIRFSRVTEVPATNQIVETCMGCSFNCNVFEVSCKHLLCASCIKSPCKMCEFVNADEEKSKSSTIPRNSSNNEKCFLCNKPNDRKIKRRCGHPICSGCAIIRCCGSKPTTLKNDTIGTCDMCKVSRVAIQNKKCKHWRCSKCENLLCGLCKSQSLYDVKSLNNKDRVLNNQNNLASIFGAMFGLKTCKSCGEYCEEDMCKNCKSKEFLKNLGSLFFKG